MFWSSVVEGFRLLRHVEIWVGAISVVGIFLLALLGIPRLAKRMGVGFVGCIARMLLDSPFGNAAGVPSVAVRFPSFGLLPAYLATALALGYLIWAPSLIEERIQKRKPVVLDESGEKANNKKPPSALSFATIPVSTVAGYLPVFMYLQYLLAVRLP